MSIAGGDITVHDLILNHSGMHHIYPGNSRKKKRGVENIWQAVARVGSTAVRPYMWWCPGRWWPSRKFMLEGYT